MTQKEILKCMRENKKVLWFSNGWFCDSGFDPDSGKAIEVTLYACRGVDNTNVILPDGTMVESVPNSELREM